MSKIVKLDQYRDIFISKEALKYELQFQQCTLREKLNLVLDYHFYIKDEIDINPSEILKGAVLMRHLTTNALSPAMRNLAENYKPILEKYYLAKINQEESNGK